MPGFSHESVVLHQFCSVSFCCNLNHSQEHDYKPSSLSPPSDHGTWGWSLGTSDQVCFCLFFVFALQNRVNVREWECEKEIERKGGNKCFELWIILSFPFLWEFKFKQTSLSLHPQVIPSPQRKPLQEIPHLSQAVHSIFPHILIWIVEI